MPNTLLIKYATRSRPERMFAIINSVFNNADKPQNICLLLTLDSDDNSVYNKSVLSRLEPYLKEYNIKAYLGSRSTKIEAFNRDIEKVENWTYLLHVTDFTEICVKGFDTILKNFWSKEGGRSVIFDSINSNGKHTNQLHLICRDTYNIHRYLYHPDLKANFEEEELKSRLKFDILPIGLKIHRYVHPKWLYFSPDQLLIENIQYWKEDLQTLERLKK